MSSPSKILVVDDDPDIVEILRYNLRLEGYEVKTALNGKEAIKKANLFLPQIILLDVMMPEMNGIDACSQIRKTPSLKNAIYDLPKLESGEGDEIVTRNKAHISDYVKMLSGEFKYIYNHKAMKHTKRMVERFKNIKSGQSVADVKDDFKPIKRNHKTINKKTYDQNNRRLFYDKPSNTITASF